MRRFALSADERFPMLGLMEVSAGGYEIPVRLVNRLEKLTKQLIETEEEIMRIAQVTWEEIGG